MHYEDFVILLEADDRGRTVRVVRSPTGETEPEPLLLDLNDSEIVRLATAFGRAAEAAREDGDPPSNDDLPEPPVTEIGARLFNALFPATVRDLYQQSLGRVAARGQGLRIRVGVGLRSASLAKLHAVPWEYLATAGHFLALTREISIVRHLSLGLPNDRPPVPAPLSILVLAGEALQKSGLDLEKEIRELEKAWSEPGTVRIHLLPDCTLEALREELLTRDYHALHFMGHGDFSRGLLGEGTLAFRDAVGRRMWVSGTELADQLRDRTSLRLVFLNACKTAKFSPLAPYAGVATALLNVGIPAVLAMQFPLSDKAALALSRTFYRRIARGDTVDSAVAEGRLAIHRLAPHSMEWGTPVLFERLSAGHIVEPRRDELPPPAHSRMKHRTLLAVAALALALALLWSGLHFGWDVLRNTREEKPAASFPQTGGEYRGCVRDGETNEPIKGVTVSVLARSDIPEQRTDDRGNFVLKSPLLPGNDGELQVQFLRDGYKERTERITVRGVVVNADIFLSRRSAPSVKQAPDTHIPLPSRPQQMGKRRTIFADSFVDNRNLWLIWPGYGLSHVEIKDGVYEISPEPGNGFLTTRPIGLDETESFTIESRFKKREGTNSYFYGLVWGSRDEGNFYNFDITGDGHIAVTKKQNGNFYNYIDPPKFSAYINQGDAANTLSLKKEGNQIEFFVNGHLVYSTVFDPFFGPNVGFITYNGVQISIEDLAVTQTGTDNTR